MKLALGIHHSLAIAFACVLAVPATAQNWPAARPVRIILPYSPGGGGDTVVRMLGRN